MYPITIIPIWLTVVGIIVAIGLSYWVADKDNSARPLGLGAVFISLVTASCWMIDLPGWTAVIVILMTLGLFIAGMLVSETIDDWFHYGALLAAVFGKFLLGIVPFMGSVLSGESTLPTFVLFLLVLLVILALMAVLTERGRRLIGRLSPTT